MNTATRFSDAGFRFIERGEQHGQERHIIAEGYSSHLAMALPQGMAYAAVEGTVTLLLLIRQSGKHRRDITEHVKPPQASYAPSSFSPSGAEV